MDDWWAWIEVNLYKKAIVKIILKGICFKLLSKIMFLKIALLWYVLI